MIEPAMLRPCPCGWTIGRVSVERGSSGGQGGGWPGKIRITCIGCTASTGYCATEAEAVAAWNRRTPDELAARDERIAGLEEALRMWNKAFSQIPCWARKWDAFREARSAAKAALDE